MAMSFVELRKLVANLRQNLPSGMAPGKPVVILLHGLGGDHDDWVSPFQDRNWPYDHQHHPDKLDLGVHNKPPLLKLPAIHIQDHLSPRLVSNARGADGSDDRSWWHALVRAGFPAVTYSQVVGLLDPFTQGPVAQFKKFMKVLQDDVLSDPAYRTRPVVILGHSRGGLIGRAYLGDPEVKADPGGQFPSVAGLITLSSPHQGSQMALMDDRIIAFLDKVEDVVPALTNVVGRQAIDSLKAKVDAYVGAYGDEIEPGSPLFRGLEAQEPIRAGVRCTSVGGTLPRLFRLYIWSFTADSMLPRKVSGGKLEFRWRAKATEAPGASPIADGLPLHLLGIDVDEIMPGRGDGLTADKRCKFPPSFAAEEHLSFPLSHAEELWDPKLQQAIIQRLNTFH